MEIWKKLDYPDFNHLSISNTGRLKNDDGHLYKYRVQKKTGLNFLDVSTLNKKGEKVRKTIYIAHEVAKAFLPLPKDFEEVNYKVIHKPGVSKLSNLVKHLEWKSQSEINRNNALKNSENRYRLANHNKEKFKNYKPKSKKTETTSNGLVMVKRSTGRFKKNPSIKLELNGNRFLINCNAAELMKIQPEDALIFGFDFKGKKCFAFKSDDPDAFVCRAKSNNDNGLRFTSKELMIHFLDCFQYEDQDNAIYFDVKPDKKMNGFLITLSKNRQ